jgi:hypothetical protein
MGWGSIDPDTGGSPAGRVRICRDRRPIRPDRARFSRHRTHLARLRLPWPQHRPLRRVRAASARKLELRRSMRQAHLAHLAQAARIAAREVPELAQKFVFKPGTTAGRVGEGEQRARLPAQRHGQAGAGQ